MRREDIQLLPPVENFNWVENTTQLFGVNRVYYLPNHGIPGHNGIDIAVRDSKSGYGVPVRAAHAGTVTKIVQDVPWKTVGNGLQLTYEDGSFSTIYWHLSDFRVGVGEKVQAWQVIGLMGNSGAVFPAPSPACPYCGTHVHFGLKIPWAAPEYDDYVDPTPYLWRPGQKLPLQLNRDVFLGSSGDDVSWLQTVLKCEKLAGDYEPIGYFGPKTLRDAIALQRVNGLTPTIGYVGKKTRALLNEKWSAY